MDDNAPPALPAVATGPTGPIGLERAGPAVIATLGALPATFSLLYTNQHAAAYTAVAMSLMGSTLTHLVGQRVEEELRAGLASVRAEVEEVRAEGAWAALALDVRVDHLSARLSPQQVEHVGSIVEEMLRTRDAEKEKYLLALARSVGAGAAEDDGRGKVIAEVSRLGASHIRALFEINIRTKFAFRQGGRGAYVNEEAAKHLALEQLGTFGGEAVVNALEGAGFVRVGGLDVPSTTPLRAARYPGRTMAPELKTIRYVEATALGQRALTLLGYRD